jgi:protein involved in polysaccharide export with SLBB domain
MKPIKPLVFLIIIILFSGRIYSQKGDLNEEKTSPLKTIDIQQPSIDLTDFDILRQIEPMATTSTMYNDQLMEGPIDPNTYIVGPNDIFSLGLWGILNQPLPLIVSPEGSLIIPSVGEVNISGLTLAEAKEEVISKVKKRYISAEITLTLVSPRRFMVTVTGVGQGMYPTSAILRASGIISFIFSDSISLMKSGTSPAERGNFSFRNIELTRKNGDKVRIDLRKYFATRDDNFNPFLKEGDIINIPKYDWEGKFISVMGAVQFPGVFEYIEGDDLETAIQLVRGVTSVANLDSIQISRLTLDAKKMTNVYVKYEENKKMKLLPNDMITVLAYAEQRRDFRVWVLGEVIRPGLYPITLGETRLSEIIPMTGGFTSEAYLPTSELYRKLDTLFLLVRNRDTIESYFTQRLSDVISNKDEKENFEQETKYKIGRVNLDFEKLFLKGDKSQDVILRKGDIIYIADNRKQIYVYGQVSNPGYIPYKEGADCMYYIEKAGGFGDRADESEVRVIKFKTREWMEPDNAKIESDDFIYVPKVLKRDFAYDIDLIAKVASIVVSVITLALLIIQTQK